MTISDCFDGLQLGGGLSSPLSRFSRCLFHIESFFFFKKLQSLFHERFIGMYGRIFEFLNEISNDYDCFELKNWKIAKDCDRLSSFCCFSYYFVNTYIERIVL